MQPRILTFATVPVGSTSPAQTVTIKNTGASGLPIAWVGLAGADAAEFVRVRNCPDVRRGSAVHRDGLLHATHRREPGGGLVFSAGGEPASRRPSAALRSDAEVVARVRLDDVSL